MYEHDRRRPHRHRHGKQLVQLCQVRVERPNGHKLMPIHPLARVQEQHQHALAMRILVGVGGHVEPPVFDGGVRIVADFHLLWQRTFPQAVGK